MANLNRSRTGISLPPEQRARVLLTIAAPKLTEEIVRECRRRHASGERNRDLAKEFGVTDGAMHQAINGQSWKWVKT